MKINILLTCAGGLVIPGIINALREMPECDKIVAVDTMTDSIGFHFADNWEIVPPGNAPVYIDTIKKICRKYDIHVILPFSDEEVLAYSIHQNAFEQDKIGILCSSMQSTKLALDKGLMFEFLEKNGVLVPVYALPDTKKEIKHFAEQAGYPDKNFMAKPRSGRGGRGVMTISETIDVMNCKNSNVMRLNWYLESLTDEECSKIVLMEYLDGEDFSVDCLARAGEAVSIVPRKRITSLGGPSQTGQIVNFPELIPYVQKIIKTMGFNSNINLQFKCRQGTQVPFLYEINPRLSGTIAANQAAGINLLAYGIKQALKMNFHIASHVKPVRMVRYFTEHYENDPDGQKK